MNSESHFDYKAENVGFRNAPSNVLLMLVTFLPLAALAVGVGCLLSDWVYTLRR